jgi:prophage tail gpP-like protein
VALASSSARAPAVAISVNGVAVGGVIEAEVFSNSHLAANRFRLRVALDVSGAAVWSSGPLQVSIQFGLDGAWVPMLLGQADFVEIDPIRREVSVDGRDLTALFIEARTQETFQNQTASDIAILLATRQGLIPNVTATASPVGRNFQSQYARTTLDQHGRFTTEWDLLTRLADQEGFDVWVDQQVLNFMAPAALTTVALTPGDCVSLRLERTLSLEGALSVAVRSWDCRGQTSISQTATLGGGSGGSPDYVIVRPNVTADMAQTIAQRVLGEMAQHALCIDVELPGELTMQPRMGLALSDTGTDFDGLYVISDVERRMSFGHGFTQHVRARVPAWIASSI